MLGEGLGQKKKADKKTGWNYNLINVFPCSMFLSMQMSIFPSTINFDDNWDNKFIKNLQYYFSMNHFFYILEAIF